MRFRKRSNSITVTRESVRPFKLCWFLTFFVRYYYPIDLIFGVQYYKRSISIIKFYKCKYVLKQYSVFQKFCNKCMCNFVSTYLYSFSAYSVLALHSVNVRLSYSFRTSMDVVILVKLWIWIYFLCFLYTYYRETKKDNNVSLQRNSKLKYSNKKLINVKSGRVEILFNLQSF